MTKLGKEMEALRKKIQSLENTRLALDKDKVRHLLKEQSNEIFYLKFFHKLNIPRPLKILKKVSLMVRNLPSYSFF